MNTDLLFQIVLSIVLPAVITGGILFWGRVVYRRYEFFGGCLTALAVALGFLVGHWVLFGPPVWPPRQCPHGLIWLSMASVLVGAFKQKIAHRRGLAWILRGGWLLLSVLIQSFALVEHDWTPLQAIGSILVLVLSGLFFWAALEALNQEASPRESVLVWLVYIGMASVIIVLSGSAELGQTAGVLASCLAVVWLATILRWPSIYLPVAMTVVVTTLAGVVQEDYLYGDLSFVSVLCLLAAPWAGLLAIRWVANRNIWLRMLTLTTATSLVSGVAILWVILHTPVGSY